MVNITPCDRCDGEVKMQEIIDILNKCKLSKCRLKYNDVKMFFTKTKDEYWVQRSENQWYGLSISPEGKIMYSYPHLRNINDDTEIHLENCQLEEKMNGTNIIISEYDGVVNIRTRMNPNSIEFPVPTFFNETISQIANKELSKYISNLRKEMLEKYPSWYIYEADGTYVGLKTQETVRHMVNVDKITSAHPNFVYYFELLGRINPIIVDSEFKYGRYNIDYGMILFDIFNKNDLSFLSRKDKEKIAVEQRLILVPVKYNFSKIEDLRKAIPEIKKAADDKLSEGFVLKNGIDIIKLKSDIVLTSARRLYAILKGYIDLNDMSNYISKVVTVEYLKMPEKFNELVELIEEEAKADYPEEIIIKQSSQIQKRIAYFMSILVTNELIKEHKFETSDEMYRFLNSELPRRFEPLRSYIDYDLEKSVTDKKLKEEMKRRRVELFSKVSKYCMKTLGIDRGKRR